MSAKPTRPVKVESERKYPELFDLCVRVIQRLDREEAERKGEKGAA